MCGLLGALAGHLEEEDVLFALFFPELFGLREDFAAGVALTPLPIFRMLMPLMDDLVTDEELADVGDCGRS